MKNIVKILIAEIVAAIIIFGVLVYVTTASSSENVIIYYDTDGTTEISRQEVTSGEPFTILDDDVATQERWTSPDKGLTFATNQVVKWSDGLFPLKLQPYTWDTGIGGSGGTDDDSGGSGDSGSTEGYVSPLEIFDSEGTNESGLHIGDFVSYDAGTWTQGEIDAIQTGAIGSLVTANGSTTKPSTAFQFGGFTAGMSRNENATPYSTSYNYVKDASTGSAITGWRVFDIEDDGTVILISAGNPEDYYHPYVSGQSYAYASEYILTGQETNSESSSYQKRDWSDYINSSQKATSATVLTKSKLDSWYSKYIVAGANTWTNATFQKIYTDEAYIKYQNMIENYSYYWLSEANNSSYVYDVRPYVRCVNLGSNFAFGVRVLVSLSSEVKFTAERTGIITVTGGNTTSYGGDQTYNVWGIQ